MAEKMYEQVELYARIDNEEEESLITSLIEVAKIYLSNAGVTKTSGDLYELAIKMLVTHWYENREIIGKSDKFPYSLDSIITQLKYC